MGSTYNYEAPNQGFTYHLPVNFQFFPLKGEGVDCLILVPAKGFDNKISGAKHRKSAPNVPINEIYFKKLVLEKAIKVDCSAFLKCFPESSGSFRTPKCFRTVG